MNWTRPMPVIEVLQNVVRVTNLETNRQGSGFLVTAAGRQHVVTTMHGHGPDEDTTLEITQITGDAVSQTNATRVAHDAQGDVAVYRLLTDLNTTALPLPTVGGRYMMGQPVIIVGYPALEHDVAVGSGESRPFPMLKSGVIAGMPTGRLYLDLIANAGFSGGPVVFVDAHDGKPKVAGIVLGTFEDLTSRGGSAPGDDWRRAAGFSVAAAAPTVARLLSGLE